MVCPRFTSTEFPRQYTESFEFGKGSLGYKNDALEKNLSRRGDRESTVYDGMECSSMASYEMPLDGDEEKKPG